MAASDERRYQVFISSTFKDLQDERQKVLQAVLELKAFPAGMELFPSADDEQWEFIKREIESSDYYVVIVGGMYGSLAPDGLSYTEKEYDYAVQVGKPVLGFLVKDLDDLKGSRLEKDPGQKQKLDAFRDKVKHGKLVKFFGNPDELKGHVLQALMYSFQLRPMEGWVRAKNARRLEDLEEMTRLQKRVMELQEENARLTTDPTATFAQGDDAVEWDVRLKSWATPDGQQVDPPVEGFRFSATWNQLLQIAFMEAEPLVGEQVIKVRFLSFIGYQIKRAHPSAIEWLAGPLKRGELTAQIEHANLRRIFIDVQKQLSGLDLINPDVRQSLQVPTTFWSLTQKGRAQLVMISGKLRAGSKEPAAPATFVSS